MSIEEKQQKKRTYCAIYTRKSTTEGLDQDFTSLDAQREAAENYISSQKHEGWTVLRERYDDGGFTGANTDRPALQKLLTDIKFGQINCVIVYKVDRLSRSLMDFSRLLECFDKNNVAFVSVTQQFNTNSSMGRLTLNILLSFAQFEREIISERTKDKLGAARKRGQWLGGHTPFGYDREKDSKKLIINPDDEKLVKEIFELYLKENSLLKVVKILDDQGYRTKSRVTKKGGNYGGKKFGVSQIQHLLNNFLYIGKVKYAGQIYDGQQPSIIDETTFNKVQQKISENRVLRKALKNFECAGLLKYLLKCKTCGSSMVHTYTIKQNKQQYRYYFCTNAQKHRYSSCPNRSVNAQAIESELLAILRKILQENTGQNNTEHKNEIDALLSSGWDAQSFEEKHRVLKTLLKEVDCNVNERKLGLTFNDSNVRLEFNVDVKKSRFITQWRKEKELIKEPKILRSLILAHQLQQLMNKGQIKDLRQASQWLHMSQSRLNHILSLLLLSPSIQSEIINGDSQKIDLIPEYKVLLLAAEFSWDNQAQLWREIKQSLPDN